MNKNQIIFTAAGVVLAGVVALFFLLGPDLEDKIVFPYISHQKPMVDPHLPSAVPIADKLDEVQFDGLFNISANPSGIIYEDGLGTFVNIDRNNIVTVKLNATKKWSESYDIKKDGDDVKITEGSPKYFTADDLRFTLNRIQNLGSLSPDYILVSQALKSINFDGPDAGGNIKFSFKDDRIWTEPDIKEVLSFKILPKDSDLNALTYNTGTSAFLTIPTETGVPDYMRRPSGEAYISNVLLAPFIDNSTFTTELKNNNINVLLETPFGSLSPVLDDPDDFFPKSNTSTTFFALLFNTEKLNRKQRSELRKLIDNKKILERFFKTGTEQQRNIVDFRGSRNNYADYLNNSLFPSSTYYVSEKVVIPSIDRSPVDMSALRDTVKIGACLNYGYREELSELIEILNDKELFKGKIKAVAIDNDDVKKGNYDAIIVAIGGYRSNFLFDLYELFMREPDLNIHKINLLTFSNDKGAKTVSPATWRPQRNFFRLDASRAGEDYEDLTTLLDYVYGFMSTRHLGDKQVYAERIDMLENKLALGRWLFSLPSLAYFSTQFDSTTVNLYGVASQLSTIEQWKERNK